LQNTTQTNPTPISVATPETSSGFFATALSEQQLPALAARFGAWVGALLGRPVRFGRNILVTSHAHVTELLSRDLEFRIGPLNGERIEAVNGPFVLGMDRCVTLANERGALYDALAKVDLDPIRKAVAAEAAAKAAAVASIDVVGITRDRSRPDGASLFGVTGPNDELFMDVARAVFAHIFSTSQATRWSSDAHWRQPR
jgi:hypothetical protein